MSGTAVIQLVHLSKNHLPSLLVLPHVLKGRPILRKNRHRQIKLVSSRPDLARPPSLLALLHVLKGRPLLRENRHRKSRVVSNLPGLARSPSLLALLQALKGSTLLRESGKGTDK